MFIYKMLVIYFIIIILIFLAIRLYYLSIHKNTVHNKRKEPINSMIILGSGGHTAEMITICKELNKDWYSPRTYIIANTDTTSINRLVEIETGNHLKTCNIIQIFRSRQVRQSYLTSVFTTIYATLSCIPIVYRCHPELILCNGPGTSIPICVIAFLFKILFIQPHCKIVFIESFCRVRTLSLSGKILLRIADLFVVHWPSQQKFSPNIKYYGKLM